MLLLSIDLFRVLNDSLVGMGVFTPSATSSWILATGFWRDEGVWDDSSIWID